MAFYRDSTRLQTAVSREKCPDLRKYWRLRPAFALVSVAVSAASPAPAGEYLGRIGSNPFCADCTANPFAPISNPFNPNSPRNAFGKYGSPYSPYSASNPYAVRTPRVYGDAGDDE